MIKITQSKHEREKLSREIKYQLSTNFRKKLDSIRKPSFAESPKTFSSNQLYEPIQLYKLMPMKTKVTTDLSSIARERAEIDKNRNLNKRNSLESGIFLDKI